MKVDRLFWRRRTEVAAGALLLISFLPTTGRSGDLLSELKQAITDGTYGTIDSLLIWHDGDLIVEEYYHGYSANLRHPIYSTTKSVTSALVGIAIDRGAIEGVDNKLLDYFPDYTPANLDERKQAITLGDMLKMQAGFRWDEFSLPFGTPGNSWYDLTHSDRNWMEHVLDLEMSAAPGEEYIYNTGSTLLLSRVLSESLGTPVSKFAADTLFADLGITSATWRSTPQGETNTGTFMEMRPLDMLKIGQLYLNGGYWQPDEQSPGKQVISSQWVAESTQPYVREGMLGSDWLGPFNYGYQWWRFRDDAEEVSDLAVNDVFFSWGYAGQFIFVVPHLDLVVVSTANQDWVGDEFIPALSRFIFPAIDDRSKVTLANAIYGVIDDDSDSVFDDLGDLVVDKLPAQAGFVGEVDTESKNRLGRLVAKFALPENGTGRVLKSATLRFFLTDLNGAPAGPVSLFHSVADNDEQLLASDFQETSYVDSDLDLVGPTDEAGQYYELDVTDLVLADYANDAATPISAFRLQVTEAAFGEDDHSALYHFAMPKDYLHRPELVLTFVPEPATGMILLVCTALSSLALARGHRNWF